MALTTLELFGSGGYAADGASSGGSVAVVIPPEEVAAAGAMAIFVWILNQMVLASKADAAGANVINRSMTELSDGSIQMRYNVTVTVPASSVDEHLAENVVDPFA